MELIDALDWSQIVHDAAVISFYLPDIEVTSSDDRSLDTYGYSESEEMFFYKITKYLLLLILTVG